jgi:PleD family two-component response regulator
MSANILYVTNHLNRADALKAICADENFALTVSTPDGQLDISAYDLVFRDASLEVGLGGVLNICPIVAIYDVSIAAELQAAVLSDAIDVLAFPFNPIETVSRLRCLSRLQMLQDELRIRSTGATLGAKTLPVLAIGADPSCKAVQHALTNSFNVESASDDITGLLRAAQSQWLCVIMALSDESRDAATLIRQLRMLDCTRTTPILVHTVSTDTRCEAALQAGANDVVLAGCLSAELIKRVSALALRKSVLDALRAEAALIAPLSDFDHATGLPGPTQQCRPALSA